MLSIAQLLYTRKNLLTLLEIRIIWTIFEEGHRKTSCSLLILSKTRVP